MRRQCPHDGVGFGWARERRVGGLGCSHHLVDAAIGAIDGNNAKRLVDGDIVRGCLVLAAYVASLLCTLRWTRIGRAG